MGGGGFGATIVEFGENRIMFRSRLNAGGAIARERSSEGTIGDSATVTRPIDVSDFFGRVIIRQNIVSTPSEQYTHRVILIMFEERGEQKSIVATGKHLVTKKTNNNTSV
jgi:hypothetical protein